MGRRRKAQPVTLAVTRALAQVPTQTLNRDMDPTPERLARAGYSVALQLGTRRVQIIGPARTGPIGGDGVIRIAQAPLDRLYARDQLDADPERARQLFEAGDKLRNHHYLGGLSGFPANDLNGSGGGHPASRTPITETMERNRRALRLAETAMDPGDWTAVRAVVLDEQGLEEAGRAVGYGNRQAAAAVALDRVRRGLGLLAELWGYTPPRHQPVTSLVADNTGSAQAGTEVPSSGAVRSQTQVAQHPPS